ncbi:hypothetical protein D9M72_583750 [compost metagenome]
MQGNAGPLGRVRQTADIGKRLQCARPPVQQCAGIGCRADARSRLSRIEKLDRRTALLPLRRPVLDFLQARIADGAV